MKLWGVLICAILLWGNLWASDYRWPTQDWTTALPETLGVNGSEFERFLRYAFPENLDWDSRRGIRTEGLLVIKDGLLVYEKYERGFGPQQRHICWSVSKMLANALIGIAEQHGLLNRMDPVQRFVFNDHATEYDSLNIRDLLYWSSGFRWSETYEWNPLRSSVLAMLYGRGINSMGRYVSQFEFSHKPGSHDRYSSGDTNLLSLILRNAIANDERYWNYPWKELFEPLGIRSAVIERDMTATFVLSSYLQLSPRDLAKLGLLYLNDGVWNKKQILPRGWVHASTQLSPTARRFAQPHKPHHGMHVWTNQEDLSRGVRRPFPDVPSNMFAALGHWGQGLFILPSERLIVVRMADDRDESFDINRFLRLLLNSFPESAVGSRE